MEKKKIKFANLYETKVKDKTIYEGYAIHEIDGKDVYVPLSKNDIEHIKSAFNKPQE
jgi:hypothetical protein